MARIDAVSSCSWNETIETLLVACWDIEWWKIIIFFVVPEMITGRHPQWDQAHSVSRGIISFRQSMQENLLLGFPRSSLHFKSQRFRPSDTAEDLVVLMANFFLIPVVFNLPWIVPSCLRISGHSIVSETRKRYLNMQNVVGIIVFRQSELMIAGFIWPTKNPAP